jgi:hypothetical protein
MQGRRGANRFDRAQGLHAAGAAPGLYRQYSCALHHRPISRAFARLLSWGKDELLLSSADWMSRNMVRRVELAWPVLDKSCASA